MVHLVERGGRVSQKIKLACQSVKQPPTPLDVVSKDQISKVWTKKLFEFLGAFQCIEGKKLEQCQRGRDENLEQRQLHQDSKYSMSQEGRKALSNFNNKETGQSNIMIG